jgi:LPS sulfotransferase NodH
MKSKQNRMGPDDHQWAERFAQQALAGTELAELEMISPVFDELSTTQQQAPQNFLILSAPRSGSYYLCRRLWLDGLGKPMEYLNGLHLSILKRRMKLPLEHPRILRRWRDQPAQRLQQTLSIISDARQANKWFGFKLQPQQLKPWTRPRQTPFDLFTETFQGWSVLPLLRRDWYRQLASLIFSRATGAYDLGLIYTWADRSTTGAGPLFTSERLRKASRQLSEATTFITDWLENNPSHQPLWFEDLLEWSPETWQQQLSKQLPSLLNTDQQKLLQRIGSKALTRREDPFASAKSTLIRELTAQLRDHPDAQPPKALQQLIST